MDDADAGRMATGHAGTLAVVERQRRDATMP